VALSSLIGWIGCTGHLALALLVSFRGGGSKVSLPLVLLCLDLFGWNAAALAYDLSGQAEWHWLDTALSPFTPPLTLHVVLAFVGRARSLTAILLSSYLAFGLLAVSSLSAFVLPEADAWTHSAGWSAAFLVCEAPVLGLSFWFLGSHLRRATSVEERIRTRVILLAISIGVAFGLTEFLGDFGVSVPPLGNLGTLLATALITVAGIRLGLFERAFSGAALGYALTFAAALMLAYLAVFEWFGTSRGAVIVGSAVLSLSLAAITREAVMLRAARRYRADQLLTMGRFAAQMSHDLKNPLAAMKGAVEFLVEDLARKGSLTDQREMLPLLLAQIARMTKVIDDYKRLGRVEVERKTVDARELVESVLALQSLAPPAGVTFTTRLPPGAVTARLDPDLVAGALENVVRNALEAMPGGGALNIELSVAPKELGGGVVISLSDTGTGMDARQVEQAFDDFYTTKAEGSGLGLSLVRRVADAHGGSVEIASEPERGTRVVIRLPDR
jgi:two-component system sensor histidine kinase HydH